MLEIFGRVIHRYRFGSLICLIVGGDCNVVFALCKRNFRGVFPVRLGDDCSFVNRSADDNGGAFAGGS